ncbi:KGW motif small protein [Acinetobacter guerrae]|nr:KGW motif small protein [Acinetobacter guerrae]
MEKNNQMRSRKRKGWMWFGAVITAELLWILGNYLVLQS